MKKFSPHTYDGEHPPDRADVRKGYKTYPKTQEEIDLESSERGQEAIQKVREIFSEIDQSVLFNIFREYNGKAGNNTEVLSLTDVADIEIVYDPKNKNLASHYPARGIVVNSYLLQRMSVDQIVNSLIHEYLHEMTSAYSKEEVTGHDQKDVVETKEKAMFGVETHDWTTRKDVSSGSWSFVSAEAKHEFINEGITQVLADRIHSEYARRTGVRSRSVERRNLSHLSISPEAYYVNQFNVRLYIAYISAATDIPEDMVEDAVIRTYLRNGKIVPEELNDILIEKEVSSHESPFNILQQLAPPSHSEGFEERLGGEGFGLFIKSKVYLLPKEKQDEFLDRYESLIEKLRIAENQQI